MKQIVFDTDIGIDDAMALLFCHAAKDIELLAITTRFGNASVENTTRNALAVSELFAIDAPVFQGAAAPLGERLGEGYPAHVHGKNGLGNIELDAPRTSKQADTAAQALVALSKLHDGDLTIIAVGGLTNIAMALELDPGFGKRIKEVIVMGGAFGYNGHRGNVSPVAEANIASDPLAADRVFASALPTTIVGLDVTHEVKIDEAMIENLARQAGTIGQFIKQSSRHYLDFHHSISGKYSCPLHDACAVAYCLQADLFQTIEQPVRVVTEGIAIGQTIHSDDLRQYVSKSWDTIPRSTVCIGVQGQALLALFLSTLAGASNPG